MRAKLEDEIMRFNRLQKLASKGKHWPTIDEDDVNTREYAKYLLREGSTTEKRELLANLRSRVMYKDKKVTLMEE